VSNTGAEWRVTLGGTHGEYILPDRALPASRHTTATTPYSLRPHRTRHNARVNPGRKFRLPSLRPRSLSGLVLLGFAAVVLPLLLGTLGAAVEMRNLAQASERLVANGVAATQYTQSLVRQVASLERTARLYQILRRPGLLTIFQKNSALLGSTLDGLEDLPGDPDRAAVIGRMRTGITVIDQGLTSQRSARIGEALRQFTQLSRDAGELSKLAGRQTDRELKALRAETDSARKRILWQTTMLVPVTVGLVLLFTLFLARPIRRIDDAIGRIGHGRLDEPVIEEGPTDLRALARQLEWLRVRLGGISEERNRFLRHMSHELKTPLANIREGTELMLEGAVGGLNDGQREVAGILRENSLRLQRLIENLLSYSEWQAKRGGLDLIAFRLVPLVSSAVEPYQLPIGARHLTLDLAVDDVEISADRAKLRLILDNLVSNAVKFTPDGGTVTVRARLDGESLVLDVADTGPGIPPEERARIFDAFYQGATPQGSLVRGTGIGLSVVQEFVQAHGGTIAIIDGEFPGAHFRVRLPVGGAGGSDAAQSS
jgi:two-component system sensor histidine kinase GlrK